MATVHFRTPSRFEVFKLLYVKEQQRKHHDNPHWQRYDDVIELLGGTDGIHDVWGCFGWVSAEAQKRIIGFTDADITAFLEQDNVGKVYAETVLTLNRC